MFALVRCVDGDISRACDFTARDIDIRAAPVHDARIANAHAAQCAHGHRRHPDIGALLAVLRLRLCLQSVDVDILTRNGGIVHRHVRIVVSMDDGVRNIDGGGAGRSDANIFHKNVAAVLRRHVDVVPGLQDSAAHFRMDAHLPGIGRRRIVSRRGKAYTRICRCVEIFLVRSIQAIELCAVSAKSALRFVYTAYMYDLTTVVLRVIPVQLLVDLALGSRADARRIVVFILGAGKLGIRDALVNGDNGHVDAHADAACAHARHLAVKAARLFRLYVNIIRRLNRTARYMRADAAVDVVQGHGYPDAADASGSHAAGAMRRQFVRSVHIDIVGFQIAIGHQCRGFAGGVEDAHIGSQSRAEADAQAGGDQGILPVILVLRQDGNILAAPGALRLQDAVRYLRLYNGCIVHNGHAGPCRHGDHTGGHAGRDILRMAVAKVFRLNFRLAVKGSVHLIQLRADGTCILMAHDAVAGSDANFSAACRSRKGQGGGTVPGGGVHGEVLRVYVLLRVLGRGGNLRLCFPVIGFPVRGHAKRNSQRCPGAHSGRAGERTEVGIVCGVHIDIGSASVGIEIGIHNFCSSSAGFL